MSASFGDFTGTLAAGAGVVALSRREEGAGVAAFEFTILTADMAKDSTASASSLFSASATRCGGGDASGFLVARDRRGVFDTAMAPARSSSPRSTRVFYATAR